MPKVTYVAHNGTETVIDVDTGNSVMRGAVSNNVLGIDADCGGECACATCHVYVDDAWLSRVPPADAVETSMLEFVNNPKPSSRLSCQIKVTDDLDGLVIRMPASQH